MLIFANPFYKFWVGSEIKIPFILSLLLYVYLITYTFGGVFNIFLNGIGAIKLQMICDVISIAVFVGSAFLFIKIFNLGIQSLVIASIISNFYGILLAPVQYYKIINNTATGIWKRN